MESQVSQETSISNNTVKKQYFDKQFKRNLTKALKANKGEPGNIEKIQSTGRTLKEYSTEKIAEFVNRTASDIQKSVEDSLSSSSTDPNAKRCSNLATFLTTMPGRDEQINNKRCDELKLVMKLSSESFSAIKSEAGQASGAENTVDFVALNKFLYTALSGNPDVNTLNETSLAVLNDSLRLLNEQVDVAVGSDQFVDELKSKLFQSKPEDTNYSELSHLFQNPTFNPLGLPIQYFVHEESEESQQQAFEDEGKKHIKVEKHDDS